MTRIRTSTSRPRVFLCLMLLGCYLPIVASQRRERGVTRVSSSRRLQGNNGPGTTNPDDKNAGINATPSPTIEPNKVPIAAPSPSPSVTTDAQPPSPSVTTDAPSPSPSVTTDAPSPSPTVTTDAPSPSPTVTTDAPSPSPPVPMDAPSAPSAPSAPGSTSEPTYQVLENSVGNLALRLYVVDETTSASDVNEGRASDLWNGVLAGLLEVQCNSGFIMVLEQNVEGTNACASSRRLERQDDSVIWATARVSVDDVEEDGDRYMDWSVVFSVLQSGADYLEKYDSQDEALVGMEVDAGTALSGYIQDGSMDNKLPDTARSYAVDQEVDDSNDDWRYSGEIKDPIDPATFHSLRVAGMSLLLVTVVLSFLLVKISSRRKEERKLDKAVSKLERGGLVTEEGLDLMLDIGRRESYKVGLSEDLGSTGEMLKSSRSYAQTNSDDNPLGYLPSTLNPPKNDVGGKNARSFLTKGQANGDRDGTTKSSALSTKEDFQGEVGKTNDSLSETFDSLTETLDSAAGFITSLFRESPKAEDLSSNDVTRLE